MREHARDIAFRLVGKHVNSNALITALGHAKLIVVLDVQISVNFNVLDVPLVVDLVKVRHIVEDVLDVELKVDVLHPVSTIVTRIAWDGVVVQFVVLMLLVHVNPTVVSIVVVLLVLLCVPMHVLISVLRVLTLVICNAEHAPLCALLDVEPNVILHVPKNVNNPVTITAYILAVKIVVDVLTFVIPA